LTPADRLATFIVDRCDILLRTAMAKVLTTEARVTNVIIDDLGDAATTWATPPSG
jgi:hypothetical protein